AFALAIALPIAPDDLLCYIAGTTRMRWRTYVAIILLCKPWALIAYGLGISALALRFLPWRTESRHAHEVPRPSALRPRPSRRAARRRRGPAAAGAAAPRARRPRPRIGHRRRDPPPGEGGESSGPRGGHRPAGPLRRGPPEHPVPGHAAAGPVGTAAQAPDAGVGALDRGRLPRLLPRFEPPGPAVPALDRAPVPPRGHRGHAERVLRAADLRAEVRAACPDPGALQRGGHPFLPPGPLRPGAPAGRARPAP